LTPAVATDKVTASTMTADSRPAALATDPFERIHMLDILRGLALVGMFVVHFHINTQEASEFDETIRTLIWRLVESKSHGMFALLFGAGFAIQLRRAEARQRRFAGTYLRRLGALAGFGLAAHAYFGFNVLLGYAVWGTGLLVIRSWSTRALVATALVAAASVGAFRLAESRYLTMRFGAETAASVEDDRRAWAADVNGALQAAEGQERYAVLLTARLRHMAWFYTQPFSFLPGGTFALFIAGLLLIRHRVFEQALAHRRLLASLAVFGVLSWLFDNWLRDRIGLTWTLGLLRDQWLTFTYLSVAVLMMAWQPALTARLRVVGYAGRMALTNYLVQIATLDVLFSGYAVGLGPIRPGYGFAAALACFAAEVALSTWWLRRFRFGPAEWLWRSLTYGRLQPMRRPAVTMADVVEA
jgi:uncharacterized protein